MSMLDRLVGAAFAGAARLVSGVSVRWVECEPAPRPRVYFANHTSHLDLLLIWASLPPPVRAMTRPLAARDYWEKTPLRRYVVHRVFHAICLDRPAKTGSARDAALGIREAVEAVKAGGAIALFPEGTRGNARFPSEFRPGLFHIARRVPDVELVPIYLENLNRILPKGEFFPVPLLSSITFGPPIRCARDEDRDAFLARARDAVVRLGEV